VWPRDFDEKEYFEMFKLPCLALMAIVLVPIDAYATVLGFNFGGVPPNLIGFGVPQDYGDRVSSLVTRGPDYLYIYDNTGGFTPNVLASWSGEFPILAWTGIHAGDLNPPTATSQGSWTIGSTITLTPDPGCRVTLVSFDAACLQGGGCVGGELGDPGSLDFDALQILVGGQVVLDYLAEAGGDLTITGTSHQRFTPSITSTMPISINWEDNSALAFDNIYFTQSPIPLPAGIWLLGSGLLVLRRRRLC
jgi:hypothetical protein